LGPDTADPAGDDVLNGIAYDAKSGHLLVTGKFWPHIYEIHISEDGATP
jgi:glutamine cyclotransferase